MKVKKLIISVVASILLAAALTGCTGTTDNEGSAKSHKPCCYKCYYCV